MVILTVAIPIAITVYELTILGKNSVVFLGEYPSAVGITVAIYYGILLAVGIGWILGQILSVLRLKNERTKNELLHLQSQVNPHFFFNMLNNLYSLVDKDVEKSKALILKLSDLMRYSIYKSEKNSVTLEEEIAYLNSYIELHRMRYHKTIDIQFSTKIETDAMEAMPLLFIILLENAFKHGVENLRENAYVHLQLIADKTKIQFRVENNCDPEQLPENNGIGLKNLRRRLELAYPNKHRLQIKDNGTVYSAQLELQI